MRLGHALVPSEAYSPDFRVWRFDAYVPQEVAALDLQLSAGLAEREARAAAAARELDHAAMTVGLHLESIARQLLRSEAVASSRIEGFVVSHRGLSAALFDEREDESGRNTASFVAGNIRAMERALDLVRGEPFTAASILDVHRHLLERTRDAGIAGKLRTVQNWIGGSNPTRADFVPPPAEHVERLLQDLVDFANREDIPAFTQAAIVHAQFETIHPFDDGNGRVGRALIHMVLARRGAVRNVPLPISLVLANDTRSYIGGLTGYRFDDAADWLAFFVEASERAARHATRLAHRVEQLQQRWFDAAGRPRRQSAAARMLPQLLTLPIFTVETMASRLDMSVSAVNTAVERLETAGVIKRRRSVRRNRVFETAGLFAELDLFEREIGPEDRVPAASQRR